MTSAHRQRRVGSGQGRDHFAQGHQPVRLPIGERAQQNAVHDGKDGGISADPQTERQNRDCREARFTEQATGGVAQVTAESHTCMYATRREFCSADYGVGAAAFFTALCVLAGAAVRAFRAGTGSFSSASTWFRTFTSRF